MDQEKRVVVEEVALEVLKHMSPLSYLLLVDTKKLLPFIDKQGEVKKADEEFFTNIISAARDNGVDKLTLKLDKDQLTGVDMTIMKSKLKKVGFDLDVGIKGDTSVELHLEFKD